MGVAALNLRSGYQPRSTKRHPLGFREYPVRIDALQQLSPFGKTIGMSLRARSTRLTDNLRT